MDFGQALEILKSGGRVGRSGWNGKGMWLIRVTSVDWTLDLSQPEDRLERCPFIAMKTADDKMVPWLASQTDILASDWEVVRG